MKEEVQIPVSEDQEPVPIEDAKCPEGPVTSEESIWSILPAYKIQRRRKRLLMKNFTFNVQKFKVKIKMKKNPSWIQDGQWYLNGSWRLRNRDVMKREL